MILKLGSRGSALALAQAGQIAAQLKSKNPGLGVEIVVIKTSGDLFSAQPPKDAHVLAGGGTKGLFVKEIEEALADGRVDFAVHSAKDLPSELAAGLVIAAYPPREDPRDVFVGKNGASWKDLPVSARIATSSLRRERQIKAAKPGLSVVPMRGNVDTRLRKLESGDCEGLVLARAGLIRLGRCDISHEPLPIDLIVPAPGQGALAIEAAQDRKEILDLLSGLDHSKTRLEVEHERAVLKSVGGGCLTPLGALARAEASGVRMDVFWSDQQGAFSARIDGFCPKGRGPEDFACELAARLKKQSSRTA